MQLVFRIPSEKYAHIAHIRVVHADEQIIIVIIRACEAAGRLAGAADAQLGKLAPRAGMDRVAQLLRTGGRRRNPDTAESALLYGVLHDKLGHGASADVAVALAEEQISRVPETIGNSQSSLVVMDRGYPSTAAFIRMMGQGILFLVRLKTSDYKKEQATLSVPDAWVDIRLDRSRINHNKGTDIGKRMEELGHITLRMVKCPFLIIRKKCLSQTCLKKDSTASRFMKTLEKIWYQSGKTDNTTGQRGSLWKNIPIHIRGLFKSCEECLFWTES